MKKRFVLEAVTETDFSVYAINSHAKGYALCWNINKQLELDLEKIQDQKIDQSMFARYNYTTEQGVEYNIITNRSKQGYFIPDKKGVNYFFVVNKRHNETQKNQFITKLKANNEILLVFELDLTKSKYTERFIFNDKKN